MKDLSPEEIEKAKEAYLKIKIKQMEKRSAQLNKDIDLKIQGIINSMSFTVKKINN